MQYDVKFIKRKGNILQVKGPFDWNNIRNKGTGEVSVIFHEKDKISRLQQNLLYALFNDCYDYTGDSPAYWKMELLKQYMISRDLPDIPSTALDVMSKNVATDVITFAMEYMLDHGIPIKQQEWYQGADINRICFAMFMNRVCFATGRDREYCRQANDELQLAHADTVGMGNDRDEIDHIGKYAMWLSASKHSEQHTIGLSRFLEKYHIVPIKITPHIALKLGIMNKTQIRRFGHDI